MDEILKLHTTEEVMEAIENSSEPYIMCRPISSWVGMRLLRMGYNVNTDYDRYWIISTEPDEEIKKEFKCFF